ncbi:hypothetical protein OQA88_10185 [Cercophora sp. LCS_1]
MSYKRSRNTFEADLTAQQSPYVVFGTPLPPLDPDVRDDGSYVPVWKQEVRDERGRKRFHGAFTGGFSAGYATTILCFTQERTIQLTKLYSYFNTVGSKEGWTPSTFVSSRTNRRKDDDKAAQQRPEDFMDEEDLADAEEAKRIQTTAAFAGLGSTQDDAAGVNSVMGLFRPEGDTVGAKLLRKMGWKDGQGIGPKIRRKAELGLRSEGGEKGNTYFFAPENVPMIAFLKKTNHKGLGFAGESRLTPIGLSGRVTRAAESDEDEDDEANYGRPKFSLAVGRKKEKTKSRSGIGIGILNDTGSDDEDPFEIGPKISYNRVIGGGRKKKKAIIPTNPSLKAVPKFVSKKSGLGKVGLGARKCHDGRLPLDGFVFGKEEDPLTSNISSAGKYPPPTIPSDWVSTKKPKAQQEAREYLSTSDAAKTSTLDPKARAALLGEAQLPGKSVFDFLSPAARERLVAATGKADLPTAKGEIPAGYSMSEEERQQELISRIPKLEKETAIAALARGTGGGAPYADDDEKRARYRAYLEYQAGFKAAPPGKPTRLNSEDWLKELHEFFNCARIFKPMTGFMASRFTTSSSTTKLNNSASGDAGDKDLVSKPPLKPQDPAEEAAKLGMFGPMTRSVADFYPTRLLCKRFNVKPPAHVKPDEEVASGHGKKSDTSQVGSYGESMPIRQDYLALDFGPGTSSSVNSEPIPPETTLEPTAVIDSSKNEALEGARAGEDVFKAIFGDSDDEED